MLLFGIFVLSAISWGQAGKVDTAHSINGVSHEDIRNAILSLVHMFRDNTDKLERHESRERQLGELLKKSFGSVEKKQKNEEDNFHALLDTINNINARLTLMEGVMAKDVDNKQLQARLDSLEQTLETKLTVAVESAKRAESSVESSKSAADVKLNEISAAVNSMLDANTDAQKVLRHLESWDEKIMAMKPLSEGSGEDCRRATTEMLEYLRDAQGRTYNATIAAIQELKYDVLMNAEKSGSKLQQKLDAAVDSAVQEQRNVVKSVAEGTSVAEAMFKDLQKNYEQLLRETKGLSKIDEVLIQTADNVLDTKRRIEYGTHQVLLEVGELVKQQSKEVNATINGRMDEISAVILGNQKDGLTNLTVKIETEISQVWRQIGIMYTTLTASAQSLERLEKQTEAYVNGSLTTMDSMQGKVGMITGRMSEVDENLNYLLGRLSLVTQEFNQIKFGLGEALDNIRNSFHTVQDKVKKTEEEAEGPTTEAGPGPNPIADDKIKE